MHKITLYDKEQMQSFKPFLYKWALNFWPCIRGTGAWITFISSDFRHLKVKIPLSWRTKNRVGTIFGGSLYAATDPFYMILFMEVLGKEYIVWDKGANIRFKRPGKETLFVEFLITDEVLENVKKEVHAKGEFSFDLVVHIKNKDNVVFAEVTKTMYVATKDFYKIKLSKRN